MGRNSCGHSVAVKSSYFISCYQEKNDIHVRPALGLNHQDIILADDNVSVLTYHSVDLPGGEGKVAGAARGSALVVLLHDGAEQLTLPQLVGLWLAEHM